MSDPAASPDIDRLLHEPARLLALVQLALVNKADFTWLLNQTGMTRGNLSVQMSKLAEAGIVKVDKRFTNNRPQTLYQLTTSGRKALKQYKKDMQSILDSLPG
ncbi:MAG: ArsR family transcriptional regulator [Xanthomonadales bacterium]|nr:ArsR family transcriptional regulator [Xanthomonadales bacterium]